MIVEPRTVWPEQPDPDQDPFLYEETGSYDRLIRDHEEYQRDYGYED